MELLEDLGVDAHATLVLAVFLTVLLLLVDDLLHVVDGLFLSYVNGGRLVVLVLLKGFLALYDFTGLIFLVPFQEELASLITSLNRVHSGVMVDVLYAPAFRESEADLGGLKLRPQRLLQGSVKVETAAALSLCEKMVR